MRKTGHPSTPRPETIEFVESLSSEERAEFDALGRLIRHKFLTTKFAPDAVAPVQRPAVDALQTAYRRGGDDAVQPLALAYKSGGAAAVVALAARRNCSQTAPREKAAAPVRHRGSRRAGASSSTSSADPGDPEPEPRTCGGCGKPLIGKAPQAPSLREIATRPTPEGVSPVLSKALVQWVRAVGSWDLRDPREEVLIEAFVQCAAA